MKYVTMNSLDMLLSEDEKGQEYEAYRNEIRSFLPKDLQVLTAGGGSISLNDSRVQRLEILAQEGVVNIFLNGKRIEGIFVGRRKFRLQYTGVKSVTSMEAPDLDGLFMGGYGLHGFDEVELLEGGLYEHRMLFSSGIEIGIRFSDFQLQYSDD